MAAVVEYLPQVGRFSDAFILHTQLTSSPLQRTVTLRLLSRAGKKARLYSGLCPVATVSCGRITTPRLGLCSSSGQVHQGVEPLRAEVRRTCEAHHLLPAKVIFK